MKNWLCLGWEKKCIPKCNYAEIKIKNYYGKEILTVFCEKKFKFQHKFITECGFYNNNTLEKSLCPKK